MNLVSADDKSSTRQPTVNKNFSLGEEYVRKAWWSEEADGKTVEVSVEVIAYVSGIRLRKNPNGSQDLLGQVSKFDVMLQNESVQHVERAVLIWRRLTTAPDGTMTEEEDIEYCNEIGVLYQPNLEAAQNNVRLWLDDLDFAEQFDPTAGWEVPVNG